MPIAGFFLIDKPIGPTSHDVVGRLRKVTGEKTIGHAGTLDPLASGLLIVAVAKEFTKQIDRFKNLDKIYEAEITLGQTSNTDDAEGELTTVSGREPDNNEIVEALRSLVGPMEQLPPIFSAKKISGQSAYKAAREGKPVELKPVLVDIKQLDLISYNYPRVNFKATVSVGTYIRSLARDIGDRLQTGAYLSGLRRTQIGNFLVTQAAKLDDLNSPADLEPARIADMV